MSQQKTAPENVNRTESDTADQLKEVSEELVPSESGTEPVYSCYQIRLLYFLY